MKYEVTFEVLRGPAGPIPRAEATVYLSGWSSGPEKYRCDLKIKSPTATQPAVLIIGHYRDEFYLMDPLTKTVHIGNSPAVLGAAQQFLRALHMLELVHPMPFAEEINAPKQQFLGKKLVGSEECDEIRVAYAGGKREALWFIGSRDFLPRAVHRIFQTPAGVEESQQQLTELVINPTLTEDIFKPKFPPDYKQTREAAQ